MAKEAEIAIAKSEKNKGKVNPKYLFNYCAKLPKAWTWAQHPELLSVGELLQDPLYLFMDLLFLISFSFLSNV